MSKYVPTLSKAGWSKTPEEKIDYLLSDFFTSEYSQSYVFSDSICSLPYLIQSNQGNIPGLLDMIREILNRYFKSYFDSVVVDATSDAGSDDNPTGSVTITLFIQVEDNNKLYSVGKVVETMDGKINKIVKLNNTGTYN